MPETELFLGRAKAETIRRDFNRLRKTIREWNPEETEKAWERCERWLGCIRLKPEGDR